MNKAVQVKDNLTIHLSSEARTKCGKLATRSAQQIAHRLQFCITCFGRDRGLQCWSANRLGMEKIYEVKTNDNKRSRVV